MIGSTYYQWYIWFITLNIDTKIQIITTLITCIIAILSVLIAVYSVLKSNKIANDSSRPYITASLESIVVSKKSHYYILIKNFGKTGATIKSISGCENFKTENFYNPLLTLQNYFIAPNYSINTSIKIPTSHSTLTLTIKYSWNNKTIIEEFVLNPNIDTTVIYPISTN